MKRGVKNNQKEKKELRRLQSVLSRAGISSRRKAEEIIISGRVKVDGRVIKEKGFRVNTDRQKIFLDGKPLTLNAKKHYYIFNKPKGVVCTLKDSHADKKITDFFNDINERIYPVGRLDKDTEGLILLTNDGDLAFKLSHPKFNVTKEYLVTVKGSCKRSDVERIQKGIELDGKKTAPCKIRYLRENNENDVYLVVIHEGRKRQIRRMFKKVGHNVLHLKRVKYATIKLAGLESGRRRELTQKEIGVLRRTLGI